MRSETPEPTVRIIFALFSHNLFGVDFDVSSRLDVSRFEIIDADTQARFVYVLSISESLKMK